MSESSKNKIIYRCPVCLHGGTDIYLIQEKDAYRCLKCSFTGKPGEINEMYAQFKKKYRLMGKRIPLEEQRQI